MTDLNPQREQMADESMVRNLAAQATAIWPQEAPLFRRYGLAPDIRILDAGCGTGEISARLAEMYPLAKVLGIDVIEEHLDYGRRKFAQFVPRLSFDKQDVFALPAADATYDLTVCRHVVQAVPHVDRVITELARVTKPGGVVHVIAEDYNMMHFPADLPGVREFWNDAPAQFGAANGVDNFVGRHTWAHFRAAGLVDVTVDYVIVDTIRVPRETFAAVITAWRDGYAEPISQFTKWSLEDARRCFDLTIGAILDPTKYCVWMVPVIAGRKGA